MFLELRLCASIRRTCWLLMAYFLLFVLLYRRSAAVERLKWELEFPDYESSATLLQELLASIGAEGWNSDYYL